MSLDHNTDFIVAPMARIHQSWCQLGKVDVDTFLSNKPGSTGQRVILHNVKLGSCLFDELNQQLSSRGYVPEYTLKMNECESYSEVSSWLEQGLCFSVLITEPIGVSLLNLFFSLKAFFGQLSFVIVARQDWDFRTAYRSIPFFMREILYVDFPSSIIKQDPFFNSDEALVEKQFLETKLLPFRVSSYCPDIEFLSLVPEIDSKAFKSSEFLQNVTLDFFKEESPSIGFVTKTLHLMKGIEHSAYRLTYRSIENFFRLMNYCYELGASGFVWVVKASKATSKSLSKMIVLFYWREWAWSLSYPIRKIYYFSRYQYKKRILKLNVAVEGKGSGD